MIIVQIVCLDSSDEFDIYTNFQHDRAVASRKIRHRKNDAGPKCDGRHSRFDVNDYNMFSQNNFFFFQYF